MRNWLAHKWSRLRAFDYTDLSFLYVACLLTIALVYTVFRASQLYLNEQEARALQAIQQIDQQRDLTTKLERLVALVPYQAGPQYLSTAEQLADTYAELVVHHREIANLAGSLQRRCLQRPCSVLFDQDFFTVAPEQVRKAFLDLSLPPMVREILIEEVSTLTLKYQRAVKDTLNLSIEIVRSKNKSNISFDIVAYFALIALLFVQAIFVFRPAIRRLNDSLSTRSDFLSRMSHEIRNPMNSIIGMADILKGTRLNYEQAQYVDNLLRSGRALLDMLNNLIDFSVIEGGRIKLNNYAFDLFRSVERSLSLISIQAHHKSLNVYLKMGSDVPNYLIGDSVRLEQVLNNLLNNSVKFTEQGHICLNIDLQSEDDDYVNLKFAVEDTGIGIKSEQLNEIFESFVQADSSIQRRYGGSGLGLSISREIVRLMDGRLVVESELGRGACFSFTLKLSKERRPDESSLPPLMSLRDLKIIFLVAEAESEAYRETIAKLGCEGWVGNSSQELRSLLETHPTVADEILIDDSVGIISMINARNLAAESGLSDKCVALMRSNFTKENMELLKRNGFTRFLIKPLKPWELLSLPAQMLDEEEQRAASAMAHGLVNKLREKKLRVLLVDDSNDNLFLLQEVLTPFASSVHVAENGLQALEKLRINPYDVVYMDIQMPVMDGYTAIRKIREMEAGTGRAIPVFAVTAHSGLVDAQKCREAGFTDRIVKPVVRSDIYKSLSKAFSLDLAALDASHDSRLPEKYLTKLLPTYFRTRFEDLEKLHTALGCSDFALLKQLGHKIKGSASNYGFPEVSDLSLNLELAAGKGDLIACTHIVVQMDKIFHEESLRTNKV